MHIYRHLLYIQLIQNIFYIGCHIQSLLSLVRLSVDKTYNLISPLVIRPIVSLNTSSDARVANTDIK